MFFGMNGLVIRLAFVIQGILTAVVFTLTGYVNPSARAYSAGPADAALFGMRLLTGGVPAVGPGAGFFCCWAVTRSTARALRPSAPRRRRFRRNGRHWGGGSPWAVNRKI